MFQIPFTKGGETRGSVANQYKRKTMLTVEYQFPYILKRLPIKSSFFVRTHWPARDEFIVRILQEELSPMEVAIEEIEQRTRVLVAELELKPPNIKTLQHVLQGSALPCRLT